MITNYPTQKIIKNWFKKSQMEEDSFNKFIALWISFNAFFVATFRDDFRESRFPAEWKFLNKVKSNQILLSAYKKMEKPTITKLVKFLEHGECVGEIHAATHYKKKVADMRSKNNASKAAEFSNINDFNQFINCIYQVRCNLFHGNKSDDNLADEILVRNSYEALYAFLTEVYKEYYQ